MDLLFFLLAFLAGFIVFISILYILARWLFPKLTGDDTGYDPKKGLQARVSKKRNPYSF